MSVYLQVKLFLRKEAGSCIGEISSAFGHQGEKEFSLRAFRAFGGLSSWSNLNLFPGMEPQVIKESSRMILAHLWPDSQS